MQFNHITTDLQLQEFISQLKNAETIAFDTEFVSEDTYRPDLGLIQVAWGEELAVIDPRAVEDLTPFWEELVSEDHETVVHAGREEFLFCLRAIGKCPSRWFDVQIAAGMVGIEYPASYANLVTKVVGKSVPKGETRTDWRHRPLSSRQLEYALLDVVHLEALRTHLKDRLDRLGRTEWLKGELASWQDGLKHDEKLQRWRRVSGITGLSSRSLAIVRELWRWREAEAEKTNSPPRRVLRDDLLTELARRATADPNRIRAVRGLQRRDLDRRLPHMSEAIRHALALPPSELPQRIRRNNTSHTTVIAQLLSTALASMCREQQIASSLVGTVQDMRDLVAYRLQPTSSSEQHPPALAQGWRAEIVGRRVDDLLSGKLSIRIADPTSEQPFVFEPVDGQSDP